MAKSRSVLCNTYRRIAERRGRAVNTLLRIRGVPGSNLGPVTGCLFVVLLSLSRQILG
jgi:hypothetical protein